MKRKFKIISVIILMIVISGCLLFIVYRDKGGDISKVKQTVMPSEVYSEEDINNAMDIVLEHFNSNFKDCTLTKLWYEENISESEKWAKQYNAKEGIVLISDFNTGPLSIEEGFNPNDIYSNWQWILVRNEGGKWELKTWGD